MGGKCSTDSEQVSSPYRQSEILLCLENVTYKEYFQDKKFIERFQIVPLYKAIKGTLLTKIDQRLRQDQFQAIKNIQTHLEDLVMTYYVPSQQIQDNQKLASLEAHIKEMNVICYLVIQDIKNDGKIWWDDQTFTSSKEEIRQNFRVKQKFVPRTIESPLVNHILFLIECIKSQCPWIIQDKQRYNTQIHQSKEAEKVDQLKSMYSIY